RTGPLLGLTSVMVFAAGSTLTTHQLPIDCRAQTPTALWPADATAVTLTAPALGVGVLGPDSTKLRLSSKPIETLSPILVAPKSATAALTLYVRTAPSE